MRRDEDLKPYLMAYLTSMVKLRKATPPRLSHSTAQR